MRHYHLSEFDGIINTLSGQYEKDSLNDSDDVKQELSAKMITMLPQVQGIPEDEIQVYVRSALRNKVRSIQRRSVTRAPYSCKLEYHEYKGKDAEVQSWEDAADRAFMAMKHYMPEHFQSPEVATAYSTLVGHVMDFAERIGEKAELLLSEMLSPSDSTLMAWKDMVAKFPTYRKFDFIPPATLGKILGIQKVRVRKIMEGLRVHLIVNGYSEDYFDNCFKRGQ